MDFIDHPILYSDDVANEEWRRLVNQSNGPSCFRRKTARRKMRRVIRELLKGVRPRIYLNYA